MPEITINMIAITPEEAAQMLDNIKQSILSGTKADGQYTTKECWNFTVDGEYAE